MRSEFAQLFADYEIMPPFRQLSRRTVLLTPDESTSNSLTRWEGKSATVGQLMGMRYKGWESGCEDAFVYNLGEYRLVLKFPICSKALPLPVAMKTLKFPPKQVLPPVSIPSA